MDVINDLNGSYVCTIIKRKIRMWAGQTDLAVTVRDDRLEMIGQLIGENLGHVGPLDCDAFVSKHGCYVIDLNPRIGFDYSFSYIAGRESSGSVDCVSKRPAARPRVVLHWAELRGIPR
jgi:carbamoyl-phosphate synthase large subunit